MSESTQSLTLAELCHGKITELHYALTSDKAVSELLEVLKNRGKSEDPTVIDEIRAELEGVEDSLHRIFRFLNNLEIRVDNNLG